MENVFWCCCVVIIFIFFIDYDLLFWFGFVVGYSLVNSSEVGVFKELGNVLEFDEG